MKTRTCALVIPALIATVLLFSGCPSAPQTKALFLIAGDNALSAKSLPDADKGTVALDTIQSLKITITEISLDYAGSQAPAAEGEGEGEGERVVVFSGAKEVDLRDLTGISEILSTAELKAGFYTKIRLTVENPQLVLTADLSTVITDIQLTANSRLFISGSFELPEGQTSLILLDFSDLHLVETGSGKYVWTPQLRATISVTPAHALASGTIASLDMAAKTFVLNVQDAIANIVVDYSNAQIFLVIDTGTPSGTAASLVFDTQVSVEGNLDVLGVLHADTIRILVQI